MIFLKHIISIFLPPAVLLAIHLLYYQFMPTYGPWDMTMHFLGGVTIAWSGARARTFLLEKRYVPKDTPTWLWVWLIWGSVAIAGILWEVYEWLGDVFLGTRMQPSLNDTMGDLILDLSGGALFLLSFLKKK